MLKDSFEYVTQYDLYSLFSRLKRHTQFQQKIIILVIMKNIYIKYHTLRIKLKHFIQVQLVFLIKDQTIIPPIK